LLAPIGERIHPEWTYVLHEELEMFGMGESRGRFRRNTPEQGTLF
jgi:hypothetical protein